MPCKLFIYCLLDSFQVAHAFNFQQKHSINLPITGEPALTKILDAIISAQTVFFLQTHANSNN